MTTVRCGSRTRTPAGARRHRAAGSNPGASSPGTVAGTSSATTATATPRGCSGCRRSSARSGRSARAGAVSYGRHRPACPVTTLVAPEGPDRRRAALRATGSGPLRRRVIATSIEPDGSSTTCSSVPFWRPGDSRPRRSRPAARRAGARPAGLRVAMLQLLPGRARGLGRCRRCRRLRRRSSMSTRRSSTALTPARPRAVAPGPPGAALSLEEAAAEFGVTPRAARRRTSSCSSCAGLPRPGPEDLIDIQYWGDGIEVLDPPSRICAAAPAGTRRGGRARGRAPPAALTCPGATTRRSSTGCWPSSREPRRARPAARQRSRSPWRSRPRRAARWPTSARALGTRPALHLRYLVPSRDEVTERDRRPDAGRGPGRPQLPRGVVPPRRGACGCSAWTGSGGGPCCDGSRVPRAAPHDARPVRARPVRPRPDDTVVSVEVAPPAPLARRLRPYPSVDRASRGQRRVLVRCALAGRPLGGPLVLRLGGAWTGRRPARAGRGSARRQPAEACWPRTGPRPSRGRPFGRPGALAPFARPAGRSFSGGPSPAE